jgi:hypothetical protein
MLKSDSLHIRIAVESDAAALAAFAARPQPHLGRLRAAAILIEESGLSAMRGGK